MADQIHILVAGRHPEIVPTIVRLLHNNPDWHPVGALTNAEAVNYINRQQVDILLLSSGLCGDDERLLKDQLAAGNPHAIIIQHYGGGSGLLVSEIYEALAQKLH